MNMRTSCGLAIGLVLGALCFTQATAVAEDAAAPAAARPQNWIGYSEFRTDLPGGRWVNVATRRAFLVRADGTERREVGRELIDQPYTCTAATGWSPDGKTAIVGRGWNSPENGRWEEEHRAFRSTGWRNDCFLMDMASGRFTNVTAVERVSPCNSGISFLPGGRQLLLTAVCDGVSKLFVMDLDGRHKHDVSGTKSGFIYGVSASPDGQHVAYHENYQLYVSKADGADKRHIDTGHPFNFGPTWSPDGQWLLFVSGERGKSSPYIVRPDGSGLRKVADLNGYQGWVLFLDVDDFHEGSSDVPIWGKGKPWIYYTAQTSGHTTEIFRADVSGAAQQLTHSKPGTLNYQPIPSPDGRWVCFGSNRTGVRQLYVMSADGATVYPITNVPAHYGAQWPSWQPDCPAPSVRVDFFAPRGPATHRASGFLHSLAPTQPSEELVAPLKPRTFRMSPVMPDARETGDALSIGRRVRHLDAALQVVVSDAFGYGGAFGDTAMQNIWPGDDGDWTRWENCIETLVQKSKTAEVAWQWDIWNEPDLNCFWHPPGDRKARFFETWKRAYKKLRSLVPQAVIIGPSNAYYNDHVHYAVRGPFDVEEFLTFAKANDVLPDVLSWHVWDERDIVPTVQQARAFMKAHDIPISHISLNEIVHRDHQTDPGMLVWYFANLEEADVDSACHACWPAADNCSSCRNATLCNLLTYPERQPRATWWAYKAYADITGDLVRVAGTPAVTAVAGIDPAAHKARVLLGKKAGRKESVVVALTGLHDAAYLQDDHGQVRVVLERIPNAAWNPVRRPISVRDAVVPFADTIEVSLPDFGPAEAYTICLTRPHRQAGP